MTALSTLIAVDRQYFANIFHQKLIEGKKPQPTKPWAIWGHQKKGGKAWELKFHNQVDKNSICVLLLLWQLFSEISWLQISQKVKEMKDKRAGKSEESRQRSTMSMGQSSWRWIRETARAHGSKKEYETMLSSLLGSGLPKSVLNLERAGQ